MEGEKKQIAFVLYPGLTPLDIIGPLQVMSALNIVSPEWQTVVVGERIEPMGTDVGISMIPQATFEDVPTPNTILVPGGVAPTFKQNGQHSPESLIRLKPKSLGFEQAATVPLAG